MNKQEFIRSVTVDNNLAESAWEKAGGDEAKARELLQGERIIFKGRFSDPDEGFYGLFYLDWGQNQTSLNDLNAVVLSDKSVEDVEPSMKSAEFKTQVEQYETSSAKMGGYTDQLSGVLKNVWSNPQSDVRKALESGESDRLQGLHRTIIGEELELEELSLVAESDERLKIESATPASSSSTSTATESSSRDVVLPCQIEINPVRGVPVSKISPGDMIYVEPGEVEGSEQRVVDELENHRDDSGMIPARVRSKQSTAAGNLRIDVDFDDSVKGKISCGKDVSILVPDTTRAKQQRNTGGLINLLQNEMFLGLITGAVVLLVLGIWYFLF